MRQFKKLFFIALFCSCSNRNSEAKFGKVKWNLQEDVAFVSPYREKMINDLTANYKLQGLKYLELIRLLCIPDFKDSSSLSYKIVEDFGGDIDPGYTNDLTFIFSNDSIIKSYKLVEWRKE